jgi:hypothetical protein
LRVLLTTPVLFEVEELIKESFINKGFEVIWFENKELKLDYHGTTSRCKFLRKIYFFLFFPRFRYIYKKLAEIHNLRFDIYFSINCHIVTPFLLRKLKKENPDLKTILFLWDSSRMYSWEKEIKLFKNAYTFDLSDSIRYGLKYKQNFFLKQNEAVHGLIYDLFFVGKFTPLRFDVIESILRNIEGSSVRCYIKLVISYKNLLHNKIIYKLIRKSRLRNKWINDYLINYEAYEGLIYRDNIIHKPIDLHTVQTILNKSNVIVDIPFPEQNGFSHRLVQALALGKKVLTTSKNIRNESIYNPAQIRILDLDNPYCEKDWICEQNSFPISEKLQNCELSDWINSMIDVEDI